MVQEVHSGEKIEETNDSWIKIGISAAIRYLLDSELDLGSAAT